MVEELAGLVDDGDLAAGAYAGVDAEHGERARRRSQQQVLEIVAKDLDGIGVGALLQLQPDLALYGGVQQPLPGVVDREFQVRSPVARLLAECGSCRNVVARTRGSSSMRK